MPLISSAAGPHTSAPTVACGSVPLMNSSSIDLPPGLGRSPLNGSTLTVTSPSGFAKSLIAHVLVASFMKPCQTNVVTSIEKTGLFGDTTEVSLLPFQAPAARADSPAERPSFVGGAVKP